MIIDDWYPEPQVFLKNELRTLQFIKDTPVFAEHFPFLYNNANEYYTKLKHSSRITFQFESQFDILVDGKKGAAYIGANISIDDDKYEENSYYVAVCTNNPLGARLVRKFHFDYNRPGIKHRQPHPIFHLQYAGELTNRLEELNLEYEHLDSWLSEPRLFYFPMSLALLINFVLIEFPNETNRKITELPVWRDLVRTNENFLLAPYYRICHNFMSNRSKEELFMNDFCYGYKLSI